ncbi:unnamed protein product [Zymoseptoria tritici ST99CH_3D7]|uniref:Uncharacterized protein n=2 Tax=Zymoseptoria tritici TaxID=1047171 RepID=A0A1X7S282_ZYMT9|nr:unnamed protein product [Zymoseptoria tritici ST99CH_3D7]
MASPVSTPPANSDPKLPSRPSATARTAASNNSPANVIRKRFSTDRLASPSPPSPSSRRRSSLISYSSLEDVNDLINPRTNAVRRTTQADNEGTHWHNSPLAFAILPPIAGLFFKDGSTLATDFLLLGLAAIFLNWSIKLPWDWYFSAQAKRQDVEPEPEDHGGLSDLEEETAVESASSTGDSPKEPASHKENELRSVEKEEAAASLRRQEILALLATFVFPVLAAYLLHVIRAQLSRPSTGLVSDYNLTIFLLAAEIRPCRQIVRLVTNRTLHLHRTVSGSSSSDETSTPSSVAILNTRLAALEAKISDQNLSQPTSSIAQKAELSDLSSELRKRYEPRLEGLERAVRRYEKRSTTLAMVLDQRLQSLETRLQDALSLAAVAAEHSRSRGITGWVADMIKWPINLAWDVASSLLGVVDGVYVKVKAALFGDKGSKGSRERRREKSGRDREIRKAAVR